MIAFLFYFAAATTLVAALLMILTRNPLRATMFLIISLVSLALVYIIVDAGLVAAMQILVYAGAIVVLIIFVIMLLNLQVADNFRPTYFSLTKLFGAVSATYFFYVIIQNLQNNEAITKSTINGSVYNIAQLMLTRYLFDFEAISLLLLTAVLGAVVLGLRRLV
ncbi:MAG: NADH-quinone oxidoreductase subunit J [Deltaproteobacteria bacterium]|nr:NADH-quinone oxidoreductase subunit J [Deltaproteobacteria bacterium]